MNSLSDPQAKWQPDLANVEKKGFALPQHGLQQAIRQKIKFWAKVGASKYLLSQIKHGVQLPFVQRPPPCRLPNPLWTAEELNYWKTKLLPKLLEEAAIRPVEQPTEWVMPCRLERKRN